MSAAYELAPDPRVLITLMPLLGTYQAADRIVDGLADDLTGRIVVVYHDHVDVATDEFIERFLRRLVVAGVAEIVFVGTSMLESEVCTWTARLGLDGIVRYGSRADLIGLYDRRRPR